MMLMKEKVVETEINWIKRKCHVGVRQRNSPRIISKKVKNSIKKRKRLIDGFARIGNNVLLLLLPSK